MVDGIRRSVKSTQMGLRLMSMVVSGATAKNEIWTFTLPTTAGSTAGDHAIFYDASGNAWAFALNKSGADPAPTGPLYAAVNAARKVNVDISADTTAAQVAARVETAINALTGFTTAFTTDDSAADGTLIITCDVDGAVTDAAVYNDGEGGAGSITKSKTQEGAASVAVIGEGEFDATLSGSDTEGDYTITFAKQFARAPQVAALCVTDNRIARIVQATTSLVQIQTENLSGVAADSDFHLLIIGSDETDAI